MYRTSIFQIILTILITSQSFAQHGGTTTYVFLNLPVTAREAALGGGLITVNDDDLGLCRQNPSLLTSTTNNHFSLNGVSYFAGIGYGYAGFGHSFAKYGNFDAGIQFMSYGDFLSADNTGAQTGTFTASEYAMHIGWGRALDTNFTIGANVKYIYSALEEFRSSGLAIDLATSYTNRTREICASVVVKNVGKQLTTYTDGNPEPLPFEIEAGVTKKMKHTPLRLCLTLTHLEKYDLSYVDPANSTIVDPVSGDTTQVTIGTMDKLMRHVILGTEFMLSKSFHIRFGYNYDRRRELRIDTRPAMAGFSFGFGLRISKLNLSFARSIYALAGASSTFSLTTNLTEYWAHKK